MHHGIGHMVPEGRWSGPGGRWSSPGGGGDGPVLGEEVTPPPGSKVNHLPNRYMQELRSMGGQYASYWNGSLFILALDLSPLCASIHLNGNFS